MTLRLCELLSRVPLFATPWTVARQTPLSIELPRQECWSGLLFPSPGDLPNQRIKPTSPALQADSFLSEPPGSQACYLNKTLPLWWTGYRTPRPSVTSYNCTSVYFTSKILVLFFFFLIDVTLKCLESCNLLKLLGTSEEAVPSLSSLSAPTQDIVIQTTCFSCVQTRDLGVWRPEPSLQQRRLSSGFVGRLTVPKKSNHSTFHLLKTCMYHRV